VAEEGVTDRVVNPARNYRVIYGYPLCNPYGHACVQPLQWDADGMPVFGRPLREVELPEAAQ
jgi:GH43 family beta-xylosidase